MKITIISYDNWGLNEKLVNELNKNNLHTINHINFHKLNFKYLTIFHRFINSFNKILIKRNLKHLAYGEYIINELKKMKNKI